MKLIALAVSIPIISIIWLVIEEAVVFEMITNNCGLMQSLRTILCAKSLNMTNATNNDFTSGEATQIIMIDVARIDRLMFDISGIVECTLRMMFSSYIVMKQLGWTGFIIVFIVGAAMLFNAYRGKFLQIVDEEQRAYRTKRLHNINESFHNVKSIKLFGWESKFLK